MMAAEPENKKLEYPFTAFNFKVEIHVPDVAKPLCDAAFSECDGLEMTMQPKTIRQGGDNTRQIHLNGPVNYGQLTLKRGMTSSFHLWQWFEMVQQGKATGKRFDADVILLSSDHQKNHVRFKLSRSVPTKIKAPPFNAKDGLLAIEEMQIAYERLSFQIDDSSQTQSE